MRDNSYVLEALTLGLCIWFGLASVDFDIVINVCDGKLTEEVIE